MSATRKCRRLDGKRSERRAGWSVESLEEKILVGIVGDQIRRFLHLLSGLLLDLLGGRSHLVLLPLNLLHSATKKKTVVVRSRRRRQSRHERVSRTFVTLVVGMICWCWW